MAIESSALAVVVNGDHKRLGAPNMQQHPARRVGPLEPDRPVQQC